MPLRIINPTVEDPSKRYVTPPPSGFYTKLQYYRTVAGWTSLMNQSYAEAAKRLGLMLKEDLKIEPPIPVEEIIPCIVEESEGGTNAEKERIHAAHRRIAKILASLTDRLVRYRPESLSYAWDSLEDDLRRSKAQWGPYECRQFRKGYETEGEKKKGKKKE